MRKELEDELVAIAPEWFVRNDIMASGMYFGFQCGDGWFPILKDLLLSIRALNPENFEVTQVKEKWGSLYVYAGGGSLELADQIDGLLDAARDLSETICEACGALGRLYTQGWYITLCPPCHAAWRSRLVVPEP